MEISARKLFCAIITLLTLLSLAYSLEFIELPEASYFALYCQDDIPSKKSEPSFHTDMMSRWEYVINMVSITDKLAEELTVFQREHAHETWSQLRKRKPWLDYTFRVGNPWCRHGCNATNVMKELPKQMEFLMKHFKTNQRIPRVHYREKRAIVMSGTVGWISYMERAIDKLRGKSKCEFDFEFWTEDEEARDHAFCKSTRYCYFFNDYLANITIPQTDLHRWKRKGGLKIVMLLLSHASEVLLLDVDSNPLSADGVCDLFHSNLYAETGQLFWGDLWGSRTKSFGQTTYPSAVEWNFAQVLPYDTREMESGQLLFNKTRHLDMLHVLFYFNFQPFLSNFLYGDKDIFRLTFMLFRKPFHMAEAVELGKMKDGKFCRRTIGQIGVGGDVLFAHQPNMKRNNRENTHVLWDLFCAHPSEVSYIAERCQDVPMQCLEDYPSNSKRGVWKHHVPIMTRANFATYIALDSSIKEYDVVF